MDKTAELLKKLQEDKAKYGVHLCCGRLKTGPHSMECSEVHDVEKYYGPVGKFGTITSRGEAVNFMNRGG